MIRLHNQNRTHTFIDVESGQFISLPKDGTDKSPVNADINGLQFFGKTTQDGEPSPENPVDLVSIPSQFNLTVCGRNLLKRGVFPQTINGVTLTYDAETDEFVLNGSPTTTGDIYLYLTATVVNSTGNDTQVLYPSLSTGEKISLMAIKTQAVYGVNYTGTASSLRFYINTGEGTNSIATNWVYSSLLGALDVVIASATVTSDRHGHYIKRARIDVRSNDRTLTFNNYRFKLMIARGELSASLYSPYQGSTYPYRLEDLDGNLHELCSLPDGTRDEYDRDNGILIKRVKRLTILSGTTSEPINLQAYYWTAGADSTTFNIHWNDTTNRWQSALTSHNVRCNIAKPGGGVFNCNLTLRTNDTVFQIRYPKDWFISQGYTLDVNGVRQYINDIIAANGPIVFYYPYSEPQIIPIKQYGETYDGQVWDKNEKPKSIQYHTNIFTDVGAEMQCEVRKLGNRAMGTFNWVTENGDKIITEDGDYIMFEY
jgi:hypothetical protein